MHTERRACNQSPKHPRISQLALALTVGCVTLLGTAPSALADDIQLFPSVVTGESGWESSTLAQGSPECSTECPCGDGNSAINRDPQNRNWITGSRLRDANGNPFSMPPGHRITDIRLNVHGKFPVGTPGQRIAIESYLPNGQPVALEGVAADWSFSSPASGNCFYIVSGDGVGGIYVLDLSPFRVDAQSLTQIFENMTIRTRRVGTTSPANYRVNAFRVRVFTECAPISAPTSTFVDRPTVCANDPGTITLTALGGEGGTFTWYANACGSGTPIGAGASIAIDSPTTTTTYFVRRESPCAGVTTCRSVTVTVNPIPAIAQQPQDLVVLPGHSATFCVQETADSRSCSIRWFRNGIALSDGGRISGSGTRCLTINAVTPADDGAYHALLACDCGSVVTRFAALSVCNISAHAVDTSVQGTVGETSTLNVTASGAGPFTYQWRRDLVPVPNAGRFGGVNTPELTINNVQMSDAGSYDCIVRNACTPAPGGIVTEPIQFDVYCAADFNKDRRVDSQDLFDFLSAFFSGDLRANINDDCCVDSQDFFDFVTHFLSNC